MKPIIKFGGIVYAALLFYIFFLARRRPRPTFFLYKGPVNLIPLKYKLESIATYSSLTTHDRWIFNTNFFGNIALFIPLPFFFVFLLRIQKSRSIMLFAFLTSVCIELAQFVFSIGMADIDDVILNTTGAILGVLLLKLFERMLPETYHSVYK